MFTTKHTTIPIPKSLDLSDLEHLATKLRAFKLLALRTSPSAFSSEYDSESQLPLSTWKTRITQAGSKILICVTASSDETEGIQTDIGHKPEVDVLLHGEWIGMFTMIGPISFSDYFFPNSGQPSPGPDDQEIRWQLTSLFVLNAYRGQGIAKQITLAAIAYGSSTSGRTTATRTRFRLIVHPKNKEIVGMYKKLGFIDSGRMTLAEAYVANGDGDMIPLDAEAEKWHGRFGIAMEYLV